jgi:hypothetical protein
MKRKDLKPCQMYRFTTDVGTVLRWVGSPDIDPIEAEYSVIPLGMLPLTQALLWYKRPL